MLVSTNDSIKQVELLNLFTSDDSLVFNSNDQRYSSYKKVPDSLINSPDFRGLF